MLLMKALGEPRAVIMLPVRYSRDLRVHQHSHWRQYEGPKNFVAIFEGTIPGPVR